MVLSLLSSSDILPEATTAVCPVVHPAKEKPRRCRAGLSHGGPEVEATGPVHQKNAPERAHRAVGLSRLSTRSDFDFAIGPSEKKKPAPSGPRGPKLTDAARRPESSWPALMRPQKDQRANKAEARMLSSAGSGDSPPGGL
jgi:hypothetical protein